MNNCIKKIVGIRRKFDIASPIISKPNGSPSSLVATVLSDTSIKLDWTNGATNQDGTYVYTSLDGATNWFLGATIVGNGTTADITGLTYSQTYYAKAVHFKGSKLSEYSKYSNPHFTSF